MQRSPGFLRRIAFSLLATAGILGALEGAARLLEGPGGAVASDHTTPVAFQQLPDPLFERRAGFLAFAGESVDNGLLVAVPPPPDELRVLVLGGSATAGWGLPRPASFVGIAEHLLDGAVPDRRVRLVNLGRSGWATAQLEQQLDAVVDLIHPELVLMVAGNNERLDIANAIAINGHRTAAVLRSRWLRRHVALARALGLPGLKEPRLQPGDTIPDPLRSELPAARRVDAYVLRRFERAVRRLARRSEQAGARFAVATLAVNHRFERWGDPLGMMLDEAQRQEAVRRAWAALRFGDDGSLDEVLRELHPSIQPDAALLRGELRQRSGADPRPLVQGLFAHGADIPPPPPEDRLRWAWARRLYDPQAAPAEARESLARAPISSPTGDDCYDAQLLFLAGAVQEAQAAFAACRLDAWMYRAGPELNGRLRVAAAAVGAPVIDVEAAVLDAAEHGIPGYHLFWDYCHYTPEGSEIAGHALAAGLLPLLGGGELPTPAQASADFRRRWRGRTRDPVEIERWTGVDFDGWGVTTLVREPSPAPQDAQAWAEAYAGNRLAAGVTPGEQQRAEQARAAWARARALDPGLGEALDGNLRWLDWALGSGPHPGPRRP